MGKTHPAVIVIGGTARVARPSSLEQSPSRREEGHARETSVSRLEWGADGRGGSAPPAWSTDLGPHPSPAVGATLVSLLSKWGW